LSVYTRIKSLIGEHGLVSIGTKLIGRYLDLSFERNYGLDTSGVTYLDGLSIEGRNRGRGNYYEGTRLMPLRKLIPQMRSLVAPDSALVDCGSGKGKVLIVAAECGVKQIRGVEFARELCEIAESNWAKFDARKQTGASVQIHCSDILDYAIEPNDSMFFLFNPFDTHVLNALLDRIAESVDRHPRKILIAVAFLSEPYQKVFETKPCFEKHPEVVHWACKFTLYTVSNDCPQSF
jgi:Histone methylation protein DOT1